LRRATGATEITMRFGGATLPRWLSVALNLGDSVWNLLCRLGSRLTRRRRTRAMKPIPIASDAAPAGSVTTPCRRGWRTDPNGGQHIRRRCGVGSGAIGRPVNGLIAPISIGRRKAGEHAGCRRIEGKDGTVLRECQSVESCRRGTMPLKSNSVE
jgi:hypothetical protein